MDEPNAAVDPGASPEEEKGRMGSMNLRTKFLLGIGVILLWFCSLCAFLVYLQERFILEDTAHAKSQIVLAAVEATQNYVRDILRPKMYELLGHEAFVLEAMSTSYVGRMVMDQFNATMPEYQYRRVAVNARNPSSEANPMDVGLISFFQDNPEQESWQGIVKIEGESYFMRYHPIHFIDSCMHCHGVPEQAPAALLAKYGSERGFHHSSGDLAGVSSVGIPVDIALAQVKDKALSVFIAGFLFASVLFLTISFFFNRIVVHDLRGVLAIFRGVLREEESSRSFEEKASKDEIGALTTVAKAMADHLRDTHRQLEENAQNLEKTVAERTSALRESQRQLHDKIIDRNHELQTLNTLAELTTQAISLKDILPKALRQTLKLIPAAGAGLYLIREAPSQLVLQCHENAENLVPVAPFDTSGCRIIPAEVAPDLPSSLREAACGHVSLFTGEASPNCLTIPLCCRGKVLGVITFLGVDFVDVTPELHELLFSIGRQIGIAVESLQSVEQLRMSKDLLQSVFDGITDVVVLLDKDFRVKMVNKAYLKGRNQPIGEILDRSWNELHPDGGNRTSDGGMSKALASKTPITEEAQSVSGEIFQTYYYPVMDETGEVESIVRYSKDITDQKRVENQIQKTEKLASLGQLAAGVAHEINNPLGVILCYTDLLKRQMKELPQELSDVATIEKHALNCQRIVSDLLKFAKSQTTSMQQASLNRSIEEVVQMVEGQFRKQQVEIRLDLAQDLPLMKIDVDKMKQVYLNLLVNARQAITGKGAIQIATRLMKDAGHVEISVLDSGRGIPPEIIRKVFDPFFTTKGAGEGTGLGLSVSYGIIRDHHGEIRVESETGKGTLFTILLPVNDAERERA